MLRNSLRRWTSGSPLVDALRAAAPAAPSLARFVFQPEHLEPTSLLRSAAVLVRSPMSPLEMEARDWILAGGSVADSNSILTAASPTGDATATPTLPPFGETLASADRRAVAEFLVSATSPLPAGAADGVEAFLRADLDDLVDLADAVERSGAPSAGEAGEAEKAAVAAAQQAMRDAEGARHGLMESAVVVALACDRSLLSNRGLVEHGAAASRVALGVKCQNVPLPLLGSAYLAVTSAPALAARTDLKVTHAVLRQRILSAAGGSPVAALPTIANVALGAAQHAAAGGAEPIQLLASLSTVLCHVARQIAAAPAEAMEVRRAQAEHLAAGAAALAATRSLLPSQLIGDVVPALAILCGGSRAALPDEASRRLQCALWSSLAFGRIASAPASSWEALRHDGTATAEVCDFAMPAGGVDFGARGLFFSQDGEMSQDGDSAPSGCGARVESLSAWLAERGLGALAQRAEDKAYDAAMASTTSEGEILLQNVPVLGGSFDVPLVRFSGNIAPCMSVDALCRALDGLLLGGLWRNGAGAARHVLSSPDDPNVVAVEAAIVHTRLAGLLPSSDGGESPVRATVIIPPSQVPDTRAFALAQVLDDLKLCHVQVL